MTRPGPAPGPAAVQAGTAPGVVKIRLSGNPADLTRLAHALYGAGADGIEVLEESALYANRRDPGWRCYLTVRITGS